LALVIKSKAQIKMATEAEATAPVKTQPRAYQLELFEASMRRNVIVTVSTRHEMRVMGPVDAIADRIVRWILGAARRKCELHPTREQDRGMFDGEEDRELGQQKQQQQ
jgi:hypothetical protein